MEAAREKHNSISRGVAYPSIARIISIIYIDYLYRDIFAVIQGKYR